MQKLSIIILLFYFVFSTMEAKSQLLTEEQLDTCRTYSSFSDALKIPENVYILDLSATSLSEMPQGLSKLINSHLIKQYFIYQNTTHKSK